jgi:hypothetical protein
MLAKRARSSVAWVVRSAEYSNLPSPSRGVARSLWGRSSFPQRDGDALSELAHTLVETGAAVLEVDQEAVATGLEVLRESLDYPFRRARDCVAAALVAPDLGLRSERYADA